MTAIHVPPKLGQELLHHLYLREGLQLETGHRDRHQELEDDPIYDGVANIHETSRDLITHYGTTQAFSNELVTLMPAILRNYAVDRDTIAELLESTLFSPTRRNH